MRIKVGVGKTKIIMASSKEEIPKSKAVPDIIYTKGDDRFGAVHEMW